MVERMPMNAFKRLSAESIKRSLPIEVTSYGQLLFLAVPPEEQTSGQPRDPGPAPGDRGIEIDRQKIREMWEKVRDENLEKLGREDIVRSLRREKAEQRSSFAERVKVCSADETKCVEFDALVDTGSTLTTIPEGTAKKLNLKHLKGHWAERPRIADGSHVYRPVYEAVVILKGRKAVQPVWEGPVPVIGTFTLELSGFIVNPKTMELEEIPVLGK